jgi:hypothetical protein
MARGVATVGGSLAVSRLSKIIVEMLMFELTELLQALGLQRIISPFLDLRSTL